MKKIALERKLSVQRIGVLNECNQKLIGKINALLTKEPEPALAKKYQALENAFEDVIIEEAKYLTSL